MTIRPGLYYTISFLVAISSCVAFTFRAFEIYGDEDYVYNYLGCGPNGDSVAIPMMGAVMVSFFWAMIHVATHFTFTLIRGIKTSGKDFRIRFGFYKNEKIAAWIVKSVFYLFAAFLIYDYILGFYKFYFFDFLSSLVMITTVLIYSLTLSNLIGIKKESGTTGAASF